MVKPRAAKTFRLPKITDSMQQWVAALGSELENWPKVSTKPMFGMTAYYIGEQIFAVLPRTRSFGAEKAIGIRIQGFEVKLVKSLTSDRRTVSNPIGKKWASFEVDSAQDLRAAMEWLAIAYETAKKKPAKKRS